MNTHRKRTTTWALGLLALTLSAYPPTPTGQTSAVIEKTPSSDVRTPTFAADPSGGAYLIWTASEGEETNIFVQRVEGTKPVGEAVRVNRTPGDAATHAQAPPLGAVAPDGTLYVAWIKQTDVEGRRFPASTLRVARSVDGGRTFSEPVQVHEDVGFPSSHTFHDLAVGPDGALYVSWLDARASDRARLAAQEGSEGEHRHGSGPGTQLRVARSTDGGRSFEPSVLVAEGTCPCCRTSIDVGPDGAVYVVWRHVFGENTRDIALARSADDGQTFSDPARVHADGWELDGCPHAGPSVTADGDGGVHVIWYTGAKEGRGVQYAASADGGRTFGARKTLLEGVPIAQVASSRAAAGVWLAWVNPRTSAVQAARVQDGRLEMSSETYPGTYPSLAPDDDTMRLMVQTDNGGPALYALSTSATASSAGAE